MDLIYYIGWNVGSFRISFLARPYIGWVIMASIYCMFKSQFFPFPPSSSEHYGSIANVHEDHLESNECPRYYQIQYQGTVAEEATANSKMCFFSLFIPYRRIRSKLSRLRHAKQQLTANMSQVKNSTDRYDLSHLQIGRGNLGTSQHIQE